MLRKFTTIIALLVAACSSEDGGDNTIRLTNNSAGSNNATVATNNASSGSNNVAPNNSNNVATNNNPATNNATTNNGVPRDTFAGVCNSPTFDAADRGCEYSWRCSETLTLSCSADEAQPGGVTCACITDGTAANSWAGSNAAVCSGDVGEITKLALDECGWAISYMESLQCVTATPQGDATKCTWEWQCGDVTHAIECAEDRGGQACTCVSDGRPTALAFPVTVDTCASTEADILRLVRAGCGWDIMTN